MTVLFAAVLAAAVMSADAPADAPSDLEKVRAATAEASKAFHDGDLSLADLKMHEANAALPNLPSVLLGLAKVQLAEKKPELAVETLQRYADMGLVLPQANVASFADALSTRPFEEVAKTFSANSKPIGEAKIEYRTPARPVLLEKVAVDGGGKLLLGTIRAGGVYRLEGDGPVRLKTGMRAAILGLQADPAHGDLWAAASRLPQVGLTDPDATEPVIEGSALLRLDLKTGELKAKYPLNAEGPHSWGDLAVGPDGTVYLSDGQSGVIWRLKPGASELDLFVKSKRMDSPQGMVVSPDNKTLLVADYTTGFVRIDLKSGEETRIGLPPHTTLAGSDGLTLAEGVVYAVQNGISPDRIVAVKLDADWSKAVSVKVLLRGKVLDQPTSAIVQRGSLVLVARSQWSDFIAEDGSPARHDPAPATLARLPLHK